jgi:prepilin-type N-terminal cleavage/methylation domain-containing protein
MLLTRANWNRGSRHGFTLVELLVVIAIIGILVGLTVPAVLRVQKSFEDAANKFEVQGLADAVEKYRTQYGDYPPDGSHWPIVEAHLRKALGSSVIQSEFDLLNPSGSVLSPPVHNDNDTAITPVALQRCMDPAEALVFFLGGFSSDKQRPLTGAGGPFIKSGSSYRYNPSRQNAFYEFQTGRLTLDQSGISTDEGTFGQGTNDLLPVYLARKSELPKGSPIVYFDSRTYQVIKGGTPYFNSYQPSNIAATPSSDDQGKKGAARPFLTDTGTYENPKTFQILSPGSDGRYGGRLASGVTGPGTLVLFTAKGQLFSWNGTIFMGGSRVKFDLPEQTVAGSAFDNSGNFIDEKTLGESMQ